MKIAFLSNHLSLRGTEIAMYDYAHYNETILHNTSIIITRPYTQVKHSIDTNEEAYGKFINRFPVFYYQALSDIDKIIKKHKCDLLYVIKGGENDGLLSKRVKTIVHCVFNMSQPHGDLYVCISQYVANRYGNGSYKVLPHMINIPDINEDLKQELNIPTDAIVFGRYGGLKTFDVKFVHKIIENIAEKDPNKYFIFIHTHNFCVSPHPNIIFLKGTTDVIYKTKFINTCDALLHARMDGETFGLTCGEFAMKNKPIITFTGGKDNAHLDIMRDSCIKYSNEEQLIDILENFTEIIKKVNVDDNPYKQFTPENVIMIFKELYSSILTLPS